MSCIPGQILTIPEHKVTKTMQAITSDGWPFSTGLRTTVSWFGAVKFLKTLGKFGSNVVWSSCSLTSAVTRFPSERLLPPVAVLTSTPSYPPPVAYVAQSLSTQPVCMSPAFDQSAGHRVEATHCKL